MDKQKIADKLLSARFLMATGFMATYCLIITLCTIGMLMKILNVETGVALIAAFALIVREVADDYFKRDRTKENGHTESPVSNNGK